MKFGEYLRGIEKGESVLIEHTSLSNHPLLFHTIGETYGWEKILVVDIIDSLLPVLGWLNAAGLQVPMSIARIKAGGISNWGRVVLELNPHKDPGIFLTIFTKKLKEYYSENPGTVTVILNPERVIPIQGGDRRLILSLANLASAFLGNPNRKTFYFVNREIADRSYLALLEETFTRVLVVENDGKTRIAKSPR
ncbi:hypothetical protein A3L12_00235 [Thermococcus sp. P6]|uniref:DUF257 family protein n=1 Tax=Thermococcus sp. P6 TaxID=122420 RepID=UPI000B5A0259|nr:DUF257 family protein [Thermococcus sp. P6]ASJ09840.1 hypothetical protein A3L12_00235 [Thermococcus sp. P6]